MQQIPLNLCFIWHAHQPFFVPDEEVKWRVDASYLPLIDAFVSRNLPLAFSITSGTLDRLEILRPDFIYELKSLIDSGSIILLGSLAHHPILPRLTADFAKLQLTRDIERKKQLGLGSTDILWPTELSFNLRCAALAVEYGYRAAIVDSSSREFADSTPSWVETTHGLTPKLPSAEPCRRDSVAELKGIGINKSNFKFMFRERFLANVLSTNMPNSRDYEDLFMAAARRLTTLSGHHDPIILFAEDVERLFPTHYQEFMVILDCLQNDTHTLHDVTAICNSPAPEYSYLPGTTMEVTEKLWSASTDDAWFSTYLNELCEDARRKFDVLDPQTTSQKEIVNGLLEAQDSGFHVWHFVSRSRRPFFDKLNHVENLLREI